MREDHIKSAVAFLQEPQVASAALNKKVEFLESKGLTSDEINEALRRSNNSSPASQYDQDQSPSSVSVRPPPAPAVPSYMLQQPPPIPQRDWKDYFVMATVSVGVAYGLYACAKRYILPAIMPPTPAALEADKQALEEEFQRTEQLLEQLQQDTAELKQHEKQRSEDFAKFMEEAHEVIRDIKEHADDRKQEAKLALSNVETLRDMIPRALEKHSETAASAIAELQTELKSLKQLVSRTKSNPGVPVPPASAVPTSLPGFPRKSKEDPKQPEASSAQNDGSSPPPAQQTPESKSPKEEPFVPDPKNNKGIPEWQRALG